MIANQVKRWLQLLVLRFLRNSNLKTTCSRKSTSGIDSNSNKGSYTLLKTAHKSNSKLYFPQISGVKGQLLMDYMNQSLKKVADKYAGKDEEYWKH